MSEALKDICVAVVCGGSSAEAEVSRSSGQEVASALKMTFPRTTLLELDERIAEKLISQGARVVFPVLHGPPGEDGTFQKLLEPLRLPYVGSGVQASANACDKVVAKKLFRKAGLQVADDLIVKNPSDIQNAARQIVELLGSRVVIKPSRQGSALGISLCSERQEVMRALEIAMKYQGDVLVEKWIAGKEVTAAILEREELEVFPVIEVRTPEGTWYDYEHRYQPGKSKHVIPAQISASQMVQVTEQSKAAFAVLECRDLARVDFVVPQGGEPIILEVNTLPGMTPTSLYPDAARAGGMSFERLTSHLIERAIARGSV